MDINRVCDYIILKVCEAGESLNHLKLQKLLYYAQAWHFAFYRQPLFDGKFQAWIHGPVNRQIYDRLASKSLYSDVTVEDISGDFDTNQVSGEDQMHIDDVIEAYAKYRGSQLEEMTHQELPWIEARKGYRPSERCEVEIDERSMQSYYAARLT
jgi:uncharacterized phage-associated protein